MRTGLRCIAAAALCLAFASSTLARPTAEEGRLAPRAVEALRQARVEGADAPEASTGLSNPAAVFCADQGYSYEIRSAADGSQNGICILGDGTEIDAWEYFRRETEDAD